MIGKCLQKTFSEQSRERKFSMLSLFDYFIELLMEIYINLFQLNLLLRKFSVKSQLGNDGKHEEEEKVFRVIFLGEEKGKGI